MKKKLKQALGHWVDGERFWDREADVKLMIEKIDAGAHELLVAQRRMGKTSLMREVMRILDDRYICLFIDLQKASSAEDAVVEMSLAIKPHTPLWSKTKNLFSNILGKLINGIEELNVGEIGIKLRAGLTAGNWSEQGDSLFSIMADAEKPVLLLIDEIPLMVNRMLKGDDSRITQERKARVDEFMSWLRKNSQEYQGRIRIVLSGSIGFGPILRQAGLSATINNFDPFNLKPWDEKTATGCLRALAAEYGVHFRDGAETAIVKKLGCCIPHHVQMFFTKVYESCVRKGCMDFHPKEVNDVYENEMLSIQGHVELTHYEERLKLVLDPEIFNLAVEMLTETAVSGRLTPKSPAVLARGYKFTDQEFKNATEMILLVLEHDGYLRAGKRGYYKFESSLLRDWWKKRYAQFYVPVSKREG